MRINARPSDSSARFLPLALAAAIVLIAPPGCAIDSATNTAGSPAAVTYVRGDLHTVLAQDYGAAIAATRRAIQEMEFAMVSERAGEDVAVIVARTAVDKNVEITLTRSGKNLTDIKIRVGVFGDEQLSPAILEKIKAAR